MFFGSGFGFCGIGLVGGEKAQVTMEFMVTVMLLISIFLFGLFIFQSRSEMNFSSIDRWQADSVAYRVARNINYVYLLDDNAQVLDSIVWLGADKNISFGTKTIQVNYSRGYSDAPIATSNVDWRVSDLNGFIYFKKQNGRVVVEYSE